MVSVFCMIYYISIYLLSEDWIKCVWFVIISETDSLLTQCYFHIWISLRKVSTQLIILINSNRNAIYWTVNSRVPVDV